MGNGTGEHTASRANTASGHVIVVGGGIAGLTAATYAARSGAAVTLLEARTDPGGRARTEHRHGFLVNQGPHALYKGGSAWKVLREVGVEVRGANPPLWHSWIVEHGRLHDARRPGTLGLGATRGLAAALRPGAPKRCDQGMSLSEWLGAHVAPSAHDRLRTFFRVSTYMDDPDLTEAAASLAQLQLSVKGVWYLHGGWQTLVEGLRSAAAASGVRVVTGGKVEAVTRSPSGWTVVTDDRERAAAAVVLAAGGPAHAAALLGDASPTVAQWARNARPVHAACLVTALSTLSRPRHLAVLGSDRPLYQVVHTAAADLAPDTGGHLIHTMRYEPDRQPDVDHRAELEDLMELSQPGWRDTTIDSRFSRRLVVSHDRPRANTELGSKPTVEVRDVPGVFVAGDWLTADGLLADAALGSARRAGLAAASRAGRRSVAAASA